eukprot:NODE_324_length_9702_cov_1.027491.p10 type:complete len:103 gc:universal NODE_324_length_9702_cov_1.027491:5132-4824(-)
MHAKNDKLVSYRMIVQMPPETNFRLETFLLLCMTVEFKVLKKKNHEEALAILKRIYGFSKPLIDRLNLELYIQEFFPKNPNLLGMNTGKKSTTVRKGNNAQI